MKKTYDAYVMSRLEQNIKRTYNHIMKTTKTIDSQKFLRFWFCSKPILSPTLFPQFLSVENLTSKYNN